MDMDPDPKRFMCVVAAPWLNEATGTAENGFHCLGCSHEDGPGDLRWRRKYTDKTMKNHIEQRGEIIDGKYVLATESQAERSEAWLEYVLGMESLNFSLDSQ